MRSTIRTTTMAFLMMGAAGLFSEGFAQSSVKATLGEALREQAEALFESPADHKRAAILLRQEAALRDAEDPVGIDALAVSGRLYFYAGDLASAREAMLAAADRAFDEGDVVAAAHAFLDAAYIDYRRGQAPLGDEMVEIAERLADAPILRATEQLEIQRRIRVEEPASRT